jgi:hypothetical protein
VSSLLDLLIKFVGVVGADIVDAAFVVPIGVPGAAEAAAAAAAAAEPDVVLTARGCPGVGGRWNSGVRGPVIVVAVRAIGGPPARGDASREDKPEGGCGGANVEGVLLIMGLDVLDDEPPSPPDGVDGGGGCGLLGGPPPPIIMGGGRRGPDDMILLVLYYSLSFTLWLLQ